MSIIPAFWAIDAAGFSLNLVSLLAITIVTGILVDDAIVEIENIVRHMRMGKSPYRAALEATRGGRHLDLTPKEFALLALLARHTGEPLSRPLLAEQVWDVPLTGDSNVVDVHVRRLRGKVDDPFPSKLIHTVRGVGYVLEARP